MVEHSARAGDIVQGPQAGPAMGALRDFMFERVYLGPAVRAEHEKIARRHETAVRALRRAPGAPARRRRARPCGRRADARRVGEGDELARRVTDYLAGMTDRYCIRVYSELEVPQAFAR